MNPYKSQPKHAFWSRSVSDRHISEVVDLFTPIPNLKQLKVATGGSCFAQHIGKALRQRDMKYMDLEPPPALLTAHDADRLGYGVYSCRYGNIYSVRQLVQLFDEAFGRRLPRNIIWSRGARVFDALRPGIEPDGFTCEEEVKTLRAAHLIQVRRMFEELDLFIFTLGLTETWIGRDGTALPSAPGVIAGSYERGEVEFKNFRYPEIVNDLTLFIRSLREVNSSAQVLLTVSPVPLVATATGDHVLKATIYSKSTLRAAAQDICADLEGVYYFPSYEIISGHPTRGIFFNPDLRTVSSMGVELVMKHFFSPSLDGHRGETIVENMLPSGYEHCEDALIESVVA